MENGEWRITMIQITNWKKISLHLLFLAIIFVIAVFPLYRHVSFTPPGTCFPWVHRIHEDYYYNLMVIKQGRIGFEEIDQYTSEETSSSRVHIFYLILGKLGKITGISDIGMYYTGMWGSLLLFYLYSYLLVCLLIPGKWRFLAMYLIFFTSPFPIHVGANWWTYTDIYSRLTHLPHHFISVSLMLGAMYFILRFEREKRWLWAFMAAVHLVFSLLFFALPGIIFLLALFLALGIQRKRTVLLFGYLFIFAVSLIVLYHLNNMLSSSGFPWSTFLDWEYKWYNHKVEIYPYTFWVYLISYGILLLFIPTGVLKVFKKCSFEKLLIFFMTGLPLILYISAAKHLLAVPKIRFVHTAPYFFAGIIAAWGIIYIFGKVRSRRVRKGGFFILALLLSVNTFLGIKAYFLPELNTAITETNIYIPQKYLKAMDYLNRSTSRYSNVMATYYTGSYLPVFTYNKVYIGHMVNTYNFWEKWQKAEAFFQREMTENDAENLLVSNQLDYVFWDQDEIPASYKNFLEPIFTEENITIYKFIRKRSAT